MNLLIVSFIIDVNIGGKLVEIIPVLMLLYEEGVQKPKNLTFFCPNVFGKKLKLLRQAKSNNKL